MEEKLQTLFGSLLMSGSTNELTITSVKQWLADYYTAHREEIKQFPELSNEPHYDLLMNDSTSIEESMFIAAFFYNSDVTFIAGRGSSKEVRTFAENDFPEDPLDFVSSILNRFHSVSDPVIVSKLEVSAWLGF